MTTYTPPIRVPVHLQDEIPRVGSGQRTVFVRAVGRKWVRLTTISGKPVKVLRSVWDRVKR